MPFPASGDLADIKQAHGASCPITLNGVKAADGLGTSMQVAGLDVEGLVRSATGNDSWSRDKPVADFESNGDRIEVFLE